MSKLLIKTLCAIVAIILACATVIIFGLIKPAALSVSAVSFEQESNLEYRLLNQALQGVPLHQWAEYVVKHQSYFELDVQLVARDALPQDAQLRKLNSGTTTINAYFALQDEDEYLAFYPSIQPQWLIKFVEGESELSQNPDESSLILALLVYPSLIILCSMLLGIGYLVYALSKPLLTLENAVIDFASGKHNTRIDVTENKPIAKVCRAFNSMAEKLNTTLREQQLMIAVIPHELRTPVNRIRFALDMCRDQPPAEIARNLEYLDGYSYELEQAIEDVLLLVKLDNQEIELHPLELSALLKNSCIHYQDLPNLQCSLVTANVMANANLIQRVFDNLLENASRYAHSYVSIRSQIEEGPKGAQLLIAFENDGSYSEPDKLNRLFEPFYRADDSRSRETGGIGIGLTLVKRIITHHNASITLSQPKPGVLCHHLRFNLL